MLKKLYPVVIPFFLLAFSYSTKKADKTPRTFLIPQTIAIVPFEITLASKLKHAKEFTDEDMERLKKYMSFSLQRHLFETFQKKEKRFPHTVSFQSADITNKMLSSKNISFEDFFKLDKREMCKMLEVDAIIFPQAVFGIKTKATEGQMIYPGKLEIHFAVYDSVATTSTWRFDDIREQSSPGVLYKGGNYDRANAENKYEEVLLPWAKTIDAVFQNFRADLPYKKK